MLLFEAVRYYKFFNNSYHNYSHALDVLEAVEKMTDDESVKLAAIWHDAVYIAGAKAGVNEEASSAALTKTWSRIGVDGNIPILHKATRLINQTTATHFMTANLDQSDYELGILLDADLTALSLPYNQFKKKQEDIQIENGLENGTIVSNTRSANFLSTFLHVRPRIYHFITGLEEAARANIERYVKEVYSKA